MSSLTIAGGILNVSDDVDVDYFKLGKNTGTDANYTLDRFSYPAHSG